MNGQSQRAAIGRLRLLPPFVGESVGRICRICGRERPNERFGGRGQRAIVCSVCRRLPKEVRRRELLLQEIYGFLDQSNISKKNIKRLTQIESEKIQEVAELSTLVKKIALVRPRKRRRWKMLWFEHRDLARSASEAGLFDFIYPGDGLFDEGARWLEEIDVLERDFPPGGCFGVWIEPRPHEREPSFSRILRDATD